MRLFNLNTPVMSALGKVADLVVLNLLFVICCLPLVTIGAASTALYSVTLKMVKNEENYIIKDFFYAFKSNLKVSTISWLIIVFLGTITFSYIRLIALIFGEDMNYLILFLLPLMTCFFLCVLYLFPYISRFDNTTFQTFKNSFLIAIVNFPYTLLLTLFYGLAVWFFLFFTNELTSFVGIIMGFSVCAYLTSIIYLRVFARYEQIRK